MGMPGRQFSPGSGYRYGFNGKENDNEVKGEGAQQDYGMRIYDPRVGRFLSVDPLSSEYPWNSPYAFAENEPVSNIDLDGLEKSKSNNMFSLLGQGVNKYIKETKEGIKQLPGNLKATTSDIVKVYALHPDPNAVKSLNKRIYNLSNSVNHLVQTYTTQPVLWTLTIPNRTKEENLIGLGYGMSKAAELYVMFKAPELLDGSFEYEGTKVDLMGGPKGSRYGSRWLNYDISETTIGIKDDVVNFGKHFGKNSVKSIVVNNPQAEFLKYVTESLEEGGTITVRGNLTNPYFKSIYKGKAKGLENYDVIETNPNAPNQGYKKNDGITDITGQIHELKLTKKSK